MLKADKKFLAYIDELSEKRKGDILNSPDTVKINGTTYYVSTDGCDENDGKTPETSWKTLAKVSSFPFEKGDGVRFKRGDTFRGFVQTRPGVTYAAYGSGKKPELLSWEKNLANEELWSLYDAAHNVWLLNEKIPDCGTLVFNDGEKHSRKLIPSYIGGKFVCRNDESKLFDVATEMTENLDIFCRYEATFTTRESKGQTFPVPEITENSLGDLYLRCDEGNPGKVFDSIEAVTRRSMFYVRDNENVHIDNICIKYVGIHSVAAGGKSVKGLRVTNCEIGWGGGTVQHYLGTDPNYPQGGRGTVTRFGNGVEIYGGCDDYEVSGCYIYQIYDAGMTHQITTFGNKIEMKNVRYLNNLVERCVYSIEYFLEKNGGDTESFMDGIEISGNILRFSGYGWGQQRHNTDTPAHIKGWSYENTASNYTVAGNVFDRAAYRMLHLVAKKDESCPEMYGNIYVQTLGGRIGQYGGNENGEPENLLFDDKAEEKIKTVFGEENPIVYFIQE